MHGEVRSQDRTNLRLLMTFPVFRSPGQPGSRRLKAHISFNFMRSRRIAIWKLISKRRFQGHRDGCIQIALACFGTLDSLAAARSGFGDQRLIVALNRAFQNALNAAAADARFDAAFWARCPPTICCFFATYATCGTH